MKDISSMEVSAHIYKNVVQSPYDKRLEKLNLTSLKQRHVEAGTVWASIGLKEVDSWCFL